jgi:anion-transporting  ArsA/GET3 family ATPase
VSAETGDRTGPERRRSPRDKPGGLGMRLGALDVVICCGSGGVGKTTVSAALGMAIAAAEDKRVLVLTVDPARRLATALGIKGIGAEPVRIPKARLKRAGITITGDLEAAMLDMKQAWDRMIERYSPDRATAQRILRNPLYQRITDSFVGSHEYAAIESLYELHEAREYDCIVVDTPPSRSALDFLEAPTRLTDYVGSRLLSLLSGSS